MTEALPTSISPMAMEAGGIPPSSTNLSTIAYSLASYGRLMFDDFGASYPGFPLLAGGPWHVLILTALYLTFVTLVGPASMAHRKPFELRRLMLTHNVFLVLLNSLNFLAFVWATSWGAELMLCRPFIYALASRPEKKVQVACIYLFYLSKYLDFADTVYLVLKKKRVTKLHLFHHAVMPGSLYLIYKLIPYDNLCFAALCNSFVHIFMYAYFGLAGWVGQMGPEYRKYLWWKEYITRLQLAQFLVIIGHGLYIAMDRQCPWPVVTVDLGYGVVFFPLFFSFYQNVYRADTNSKRKSMTTTTAAAVTGMNNNVEVVGPDSLTPYKQFK